MIKSNIKYIKKYKIDYQISISLKRIGIKNQKLGIIRLFDNIVKLS